MAGRTRKAMHTWWLCRVSWVYACLYKHDPERVTNNVVNADRLPNRWTIGGFQYFRTFRLSRPWLAIRDSYSDALFISLDDKTRLTYSGLRWVILRRFENAKVKPQGIHTFRRLFALTMLRNGTDIVTLSRLMGHSTTDILKKYLAQTDEDLREASAKASPIDNAL